MINITEKYNKPVRPEKVLCFGEGNFLRAFCAVTVQKLNQNAGFNGNIVMLQGVDNGLSDLINEQNGLYTVIERGFENGQAVEKSTVIDCVSHCIDPYKDYSAYLDVAANPDLELIVSNTTEFGICYDENEKAGQDIYRNFPAKLTDFLYKRYAYFNGASDKGLIILPCELIEHNGKKLKELVLKYTSDWNLEAGFVRWLIDFNVFADTLVDRIVSGYPKAEATEICQKLDYTDNLLDVCEPFFLWVIQSDSKKIKSLPLDKCGLDIIVTNDLSPYRTRKVRILNGGHTMSVLLGHLSGFTTVEEMVKDETFVTFIKKGMFEEIIPSFEGEKLKEYAGEVLERFLNPYLNHKLLDISLNSVSKFKTRVLFTIKDYIKKYGTYPKALSLSLAGLIAFYKVGADSFVRDERDLIEIIKQGSVTEILQFKTLWGSDLTDLCDGFLRYVEKCYDKIIKIGAKKAIEELNGGHL